jgi:peptide-methionine (S)-S-oxide reductase
MTTYVLAGGCFWCLDAVYRRLKGVTDVKSGYTGGAIDNPNYYQVASGETGHAEAVSITFDEMIIPSDTILDLFFLLHDPTTLNRQGADEGTQYRSGMYYTDQAQKDAFEAALERARTHWDGVIVTEVVPLREFWVAEEEHQDYFTNNPGNGYCSIVISPKISKARAAYTQWFKD